MSRRHKAEKREVNPDPKFGDLVLTKFMNAVMEQGKKSVAENIVYGALERMETKAKSDPIVMFRSALENVMPAVEVRHWLDRRAIADAANAQLREWHDCVHQKRYRCWESQSAQSVFPYNAHRPQNDRDAAAPHNDDAECCSATNVDRAR